MASVGCLGRSLGIHVACWCSTSLNMGLTTSTLNDMACPGLCLRPFIPLGHLRAVLQYVSVDVSGQKCSNKKEKRFPSAVHLSV